MQPNTISDGDHFNKVYTLIGSTQSLISIIPEFRICRFCRRDESTVTFKKDAHACSELLGKNSSIIYDECDSCNEKFSVYESHLSKFFMPYLAVVGVRGKTKIPTFQSRTEGGDESTRTVLKFEDGKVNLTLSSLDDYKIDKENNRMSIRFRCPPHKPLNVYKALVKIALSFLPTQKFNQYALLFDWLLKDTPTAYFTTLFITLLTKKKFGKPYVQLFEANSIFTDQGFYPELTLVLNFGNLVAQIFLPLSEHFDYPQSNGKSPIHEVYPAFIYNQDMKQYQGLSGDTPIKMKYKFSTIDLTSEVNCTRDEVLNFTFESGDFGIENNSEDLFQ
ncbi:MAG: hypothetical protein QM535_20210 [Limnohabitans sp.]|nr:hypothetical protein [Limnohabitans sp.]